jgi:hypothetical protein
MGAVFQIHPESQSTHGDATHVAAQELDGAALDEGQGGVKQLAGPGAVGLEGLFPGAVNDGGGG